MSRPVKARRTRSADARRLIAACTNAQLAAFGAPQRLTVRQVRERLLAAAAKKPDWVIDALTREDVQAGAPSPNHPKPASPAEEPCPTGAL